MYEVVIVLFLIVAIAMVALILVQRGKGAGMGASFGAGASNTVFGSAGSGSFLTRSTWLLAFIFFGICLFIGWMQKDRAQENTSFTNIEDTPAISTAPEAPLPADVPAVDSDVPTVPAQ